MVLNGHHSEIDPDIDPTLLQWEVESSGLPKPRRLNTAVFALIPPREGLLPPREVAAPKESSTGLVFDPERRFRAAAAPAPRSNADPDIWKLSVAGLVLLVIVFTAGMLLGQMTDERLERPSTAAAPRPSLPASSPPSGASLPVPDARLESASYPRLDEPQLREPEKAHSTSASFIIPDATAADALRAGRDPAPPLTRSAPARRTVANPRPAPAPRVVPRPVQSTPRPARMVVHRPQPRMAVQPVRPRPRSSAAARPRPNRVVSAGQNGNAGSGYNQRVLQVLDRLR